MASHLTREEILSELEPTQWDIVVIGGGITGAGILRESVRRGLKAVLVEQQDFAWGTSSRSTKMVHGGMRYLKQGNIALTRESVVERENMIKELPGLVENKQFILPYYKGNLFRRLILQLGLVAYNLLAGKWLKNRISARELIKKVPLIDREDLKGGFLINDAVTDDARLVLRVLSEATAEGGKALNYCKAERLLKEDGKVCCVVVKDEVQNREYSIKTRLLINATGVWADRLREQVGKRNNQHIRPLRGSHILLSADRLPLVNNISLMHPRDGRPVTTLVWEGRVLMGTTDIDHQNGLDSEATISRAEVDYLLEALNYQFPRAELTDKDIISTMAGIRPVIDTGKADPSKESRDHVVWLEDGLLTVTGGKLTTFRVIALDTLNKAQKVLGPLPDLKKTHKIFGVFNIRNDGPHDNLDHQNRRRLYGRYGKNAEALIAEAEKDELELIPQTQTMWAELKWAANNEMVVHLDDLMLRRTRIGLLIANSGREILDKIRQLCQKRLDWSDERWNEEEVRYLGICKKFYSVPA